MSLSYKFLPALAVFGLSQHTSAIQDTHQGVLQKSHAVIMMRRDGRRKTFNLQTPHPRSWDGYHTLRKGEKVVAKLPDNRGKTSDPWFAGNVTSIDLGSKIASIKYEDGKSATGVKEDEIRFAPTRDAQWGKGDLRGNDKIPDGAEHVKIREDPPEYEIPSYDDHTESYHVLQTDDKVVAKYPPYKGAGDDPWFAGTISSLDKAKATAGVAYEDGSNSNSVEETDIRYAPDRDPEWGQGSMRGNNVLPYGVQEVKIM
mmetsp:Transcript_108459/g.203595  ORF Transcript_108459/g.203595 Transcript_108459/m.203595 type:complete len:257 (-) Transcript_108459:64-834(-)